MHKPLPVELDFINNFRTVGQDVVDAQWRDSPFEADLWECTFADVKRTIDFRIELDDGSLLTAPKNRPFLNKIKIFLCLQNHPILTGSMVRNAKSSSFAVSIALHVVDYFLLQGLNLQVGTHGFDAVTADDIMIFADTLNSHRSIKSSIYAPKEKIIKFLMNVEVSDVDIETAMEQAPKLFEFEGDSKDWVLPLEHLSKARAWLLLNNCYHTQASWSEFKYVVHRRKLLGHAIGNRVLCPLDFRGLRLPGLDIVPAVLVTKELAAVPVSNLDGDDRASVEFVGSYTSALDSMRLGQHHGGQLISDTALKAIEESAILAKELTKERTRFTTLPFDVANKVFGKAIAFYLDYGTEIVEYYLALAANGASAADLSLPVPERLVELGVCRWRAQWDTRELFFSELRLGLNFFNMLEVLYGAIAIIVNTLMARRISELEDLTAESIVEEDGWYFLAFNLRKANVQEHRSRVLRPLPQIGAKALQLLARLSRTLQDLGYTSNPHLFAMPMSGWYTRGPQYGTLQCDLSRCFNRFCDYIETPTDDLGRRYYVRAHQLRRNFSMLFFWRGSFGGLEVLGHFLGHKSYWMTYRYITESLPGKVLRRVKATVAKDMIKANQSATEDLAELICARYKLSLNDLHILPERDVVDYVEDLLVAGDAEIEPEFVDGAEGQQYKILYKVIKRAAPRRTRDE